MFMSILQQYEALHNQACINLGSSWFQNSWQLSCSIRLNPGTLTPAPLEDALELLKKPAEAADWSYGGEWHSSFLCFCRHYSNLSSSYTGAKSNSQPHEPILSPGTKCASYREAWKMWVPWAASAVQWDLNTIPSEAYLDHQADWEVAISNTMLCEVPGCRAPSEKATKSHNLWLGRILHVYLWGYEACWLSI